MYIATLPDEEMMSRIFRIVFLLVITLLLACGTKTEQIYVSKEGDDSNNKTESTPLATIEKALEIIQRKKVRTRSTFVL